jgi:hypothetical protein
VVGAVLEMATPWSWVALVVPLQLDVATAPLPPTLKQPEAPARLLIVKFVVVALPVTRRLPAP